LQFLLGIRSAVGSQQGGQPVFVRHDVVDHRAWLDGTRPADHGWYAVAPFPVGVLLTPEVCRATIRPGEDRGAVVGRIDNNGILGDAEDIELLEEVADVAAVLLITPRGPRRWRNSGFFG
jgi:hypothetical protein